jgi:D,D-heptose 1,7-bisphosphate phosphatase
MNNRAIFLDKDGTLIEDVPYNVNPEKIRLVDGCLEALRELQAAGYQLIIISNQSGVALGKFKEEALKGVEETIRKMLAEAGLTLAGFYYCPHHPDGSIASYRAHCFCRKPNPGMLFQAAREHEINLSASWFIGDILHDVEAGRRADCRTILVDNGNETEWKFSPLRRPHYTVKDISGAVEVIARAESSSEQSRSVPVKISKPVSRNASFRA